MKERYFLVSFPEIQDFMDKEGWDRCILCQEIEGHPCPDSTYAVPEDVYYKVLGKVLDNDGLKISDLLDINPKLLDYNVLDFYDECIRMTQLYAKKNHDYGNSFAKGMDTIGSAYGVGRLYDKINRLINLTQKESEVKDESLQDTVRDLACYAIMLNNYWNRNK